MSGLLVDGMIAYHARPISTIYPKIPLHDPVTTSHLASPTIGSTYIEFDTPDYHYRHATQLDLIYDNMIAQHPEWRNIRRWDEYDDLTEPPMIGGIHISYDICR